MNSFNTSAVSESTQNVPLDENPGRSTPAPEQTYFFTGTVERVLAWNRIFKHPCYFEVIAYVLSLQEGELNCHKTILLKDKKGPILQATYYSNYNIDESVIRVGQMLRCVGYMTGVNTLTAVSIRSATSDEVAALKRFCYIGDFTISGLINGENKK
ncbi:uncharacterized protein LOC103313912 [Tribolium castaneum]|uniref:Uncharacterized protein n=1 Tax=Tribolium castaneum TaxID=7070 RepID=D6WVV1_TRICA|nr:PREDICTED: uncharacterized protein LOC103313912 [Tribolium castaneum]EFA08620.1 hypothetical protein TcasGA2_TC006283 [Tribolium castaneum]|eukprot:XP_015837993.1 PREDICTED: uncharacterized protein LOC103313912 [Tribolium castaneum]